MRLPPTQLSYHRITSLRVCLSYAMCRQMPATTFRSTIREMKSVLKTRTMSTAKSFAMIGGMFATTECLIESVGSQLLALLRLCVYMCTYDRRRKRYWRYWRCLQYLQ